MPTFFTFQQGSDTHPLPQAEVETIRYGRFHAFPTPKRSVGNLFSAFGLHASGPGGPGTARGNNPPGYGTINVDTDVDDSDDEDQGDGGRWWLDRMLISPRRKVVERMVGSWWKRQAVLVVLPAAVVIAWCAIPFPTTSLYRDNPGSDFHPGYRTLNSSDDCSRHKSSDEGASIFWLLVDAIKNVFDFSVLWDSIASFFHHIHDSIPTAPPLSPGNGKVPGHGEAVVKLNFWFFLTVYYSFYNLIALLWVTKLFNLYSLNWWPPRLGFPPTFAFFNLLPLLIAIPMYYTFPAAILNQNLTWILLTFAIMCAPVFTAFLVLFFRRQHGRIGLRQSLSETQLLFSPPSLSSNSWHSFIYRYGKSFHLARSYIRFIWFCSALLLSLIAFVLGEAYAELYLRTLPHTSLETVVYVWSWVATIHLLDIITGWILGAKVRSYPLGFVFKFYFSTTYQIYVRALYARLRSPGQFVYLQLLSSLIVLVWHPLSMTRTFHRTLEALWLTKNPYDAYAKITARSFFLRGIAENVSMLSWLGVIVVLHYGPNTHAYPYFSFNNNTAGDKGEVGVYTFELTFWASLATWACEIVAGCGVRWVVRKVFGVDVTGEAKRDFVRSPELVPAVVAAGVLVVMNMVVGVLRVRVW